jgi:hypothetical protein
MLRHEEHPSDETLLRAIDAELSVEREMALDRHLSGCEGCRLRLSAIQCTADESARVYRHSISPRVVNPAALRERVQREMAAVGAALDRSWWCRVRQRMSTLPLVAQVGASLALVLLVLQMVRPAQTLLSLATRSVPAAAEGLPIHALTPGAARSVSLETLCAGQPAVRSPIPWSVRQEVLRQYRMEHVAEHEYELDYLITPELGGVADPRNLWPERYASGIWNARVKDDLEELLPRLVCDGTLALATAQRDIANDWIAAYKKYFRTDRPLATEAGVLRSDDRVEQRHQRAGVTVRFARLRPTPLDPFRVSLIASR